MALQTESGLPVEIIDGTRYRIQSNAMAEAKRDDRWNGIELRVLVRDCVEVMTRIFAPSLDASEIRRLDVALSQEMRSLPSIEFVRVPGVTGWIRTIDDADINVD